MTDTPLSKDELRDVLLRHGFVPCDIPACNCGSWHSRYGYPERFREIADALTEAGVELNGVTLLTAIKGVLAERDLYQQKLTEAQQLAVRQAHELRKQRA